MATRYVGLGGNDGNSGLTWALRKLTLNGVEDTPVVAGDVVHIGPGVYRELLTVDVAGGNTYSTSTVTVTSGSKTVTGSGTTFVGNVFADGMFHVRFAASGNDGVANGTATFTSAAGNFQAAMIGMVIQIAGRAPYKIAAVAGVTSITLSDPLGAGWPGAGGGLSYSVMSGQGAYEIESVDNNTQLTLKEAWAGPTMSGLAYLCWRDIKYLGDVTGENTDGVGGIVRITGSDNDQTATRTHGIHGSNAKSYRTFRGLHVDLCGTSGSHGGIVMQNNTVGWVIEDCTVEHIESECCIYFYENNIPSYATVRRCWLSDPGLYDSVISFVDAADIDDDGTVIEFCIFSSGNYVVYLSNTGGVTIKNCLISEGGNSGIRQVATAGIGQATVVANCIVFNCGTGLRDISGAEMVEDYNGLWSCNTDRNNVVVGASSVTYPPLFLPPLLVKGIRMPSSLVGLLSEWSAYRRLSGWSVYNSPVGDFFGVPRSVTNSKRSWGPLQFHDAERDTGTVHGGSASIKLADAGRVQIKVPVTATSTTISVYVYREANYAGNLPQMIIKQPGQADDITTDANAASQWNLLTTTLTPAASPPYVIVELVSRNTNGANDAVYFDDLAVS